MAQLIAGSFLSSAFDAIFGMLTSVNFSRVNLDKPVRQLKFTLNSINQVLDDAEEKQYKNPYVKEWLGDVKHALYEVDQLLDEIATDAALKKQRDESEPSTTINVLSLFSPFAKNPFESRIQELLESLGSLAEQMDKLELKKGTCARNKVGLSPKPSGGLQTTSLMDDSAIKGRKGDKEKIINFLLASDKGNSVPVTNTAKNDKREIIDSLIHSDEEEEEENVSGNQAVSVISIVGLGGMGKTTLARLIYNDPMIENHFKPKAWVYVSESFDVIALTKAILESFGFSADSSYLDILQRKLQQFLRGKKYLLVLDDVWNANEECWEQLLLPFNHRSSGSKIIVTTREKKVASVLKSTMLHDLQQLDDSNSWDLFVRHAFPRKNVCEYQDLESIGKRIVDKCAGLPLAVKTLGSLLGIKFSYREWVDILETEMWRLLDDNKINPVLRLSYHNLPSSLKRCFAFCSLFPKGFKFERGDIIKMWMAEGFLNCFGTGKREEELGNEFFDDLVSISFFQQSAISFFQQSDYNDKYFFMHDLVNDLAKSVSGEFSLRVEEDRDIPERTRHIWCCMDLVDNKQILNRVFKMEGTRILILKARFGIRNIMQYDLFSSLKYLRMLVIDWRDMSELSNEISNLKLLRYLKLSNTKITRLPDSICWLYNLETLILNKCPLNELPSDFYKLVNLRHLDLSWADIRKMLKQIGSLSHLVTLSPGFLLGEESGSDIKELEKLNHLQETLCILGLENVTNPADAAAANLKDKKHLEELCMIYRYDNDKAWELNSWEDRKWELKKKYNRYKHQEMVGSIIERETSVLEALQPNSNLNKLTIRCYLGSSFPTWLGFSHLPNLVYLFLENCWSCSLLPSVGQFPFLKELHISNCHGIKIIGEDFYGSKNSSYVPFMSLQILKFEHLSNWKEWSCFEGCFRLLKQLCIEYCPNLKMALPQHLPSLQKLKIENCGDLEASIPKAANLNELWLKSCEKILVNELPPTVLKMVFIGKIRFPDHFSTSLQQNLFNSAFLEELYLEDVSGFEECSSSLDLCYCSNTPPLPLLRILKITGWRYSSLPFSRMSTNVHTFTLQDCPQLESFPAGGLPSTLSWLDIRNCPKLSASREEWGFPSSLSNLTITNCPKLIASREEWSLFQLNSLKSFRVGDKFENVQSFPEENLLPSTLSSLYLYNCSMLRIINYKGLLQLKSLEELIILGCPCLERLPEEGLPNSLSILDILECSSQLKQMYQKEGGERWHKISHIPCVNWA